MNLIHLDQSAFVHWFEEEIDMPDFSFTKHNELLVPIPGDGNPIDFFFLLFDEDFINLLVDETNSYAEKEFLVIIRVHVYRRGNPRIKTKC